MACCKLRSAKRNFKRMFLVKLLKSLIRVLREFGFGGEGMHFKPFESKVFILISKSGI